MVTAYKEAYLALEEGDTPITKCKVHVFHPNPSSIKKFPNVLRHWKKVEKMTLSKEIVIEVFEMPSWEEDII